MAEKRKLSPLLIASAAIVAAIMAWAIMGALRGDDEQPTAPASNAQPAPAPAKSPVGPPQ